MQEIKPIYVIFEQSKLLKEKGFDYHELCQDFSEYYDYNVENQYHRRHESDFPMDKYPGDDWIPVPEQWQVVEWLRIEKGIFISVLQHSINTQGMYFEAIINSKNITMSGYNSPKEAYSAAFDYVLKNVI